MHEWMQFIQTFGLAAGLLVAVLFGIYKVAVRYVDKVAEPQRIRQQQSLDHMDKVVDEHTEILRAVNTMLAKHAEINLRLETKFDQLTAAVTNGNLQITAFMRTPSGLVPDKTLENPPKP